MPFHVMLIYRSEHTRSTFIVEMSSAYQTLGQTRYIAASCYDANGIEAERNTSYSKSHAHQRGKQWTAQYRNFVL